MKPIFELNSPISRRDFLKGSTLGIFGLTALNIPFKSPDRSHGGYPASQVELGRVLKSSTTIHSAPYFSSTVLRTESINSVLSIERTLGGESNAAGNQLWYQLQDGGYLHSSGVQSVENITNPVITDFDHHGVLAQVTVPFTHAWKIQVATEPTNFIYYYGSNHWVVGLGKDEQGDSYYKVKDDRSGYIYYALANHLHIFDEDELSPIPSSNEQKEKSIEVRLKDQTIVAYEDSQPVFFSSMSSGLKEDERDYSTPPGEYRINIKLPSRHMKHAQPAEDEDRDLLGVPWISNFTDNGIAFHGTYWHNDFGKPRSHGCVNLPIPAARWIYLWSLPVVPPLTKTIFSSKGTRVTVI